MSKPKPVGFFRPRRLFYYRFARRRVLRLPSQAAGFIESKLKNNATTIATALTAGKKQKRRYDGLEIGGDLEGNRKSRHGLNEFEHAKVITRIGKCESCF